MQIFIHHNNQQLGPFTEAEVKAQLASGALSLQDHAWWQGQSGWMPLGQTIFATTAANMPAVPPVPGSVASMPPMPAPVASSKLAMWSLICGVCSLLCGIFTALPAIILGHMGLSEIKKNPAIQGRGMALTGLIIGYLVVGLCVISLIAIMVLTALGAQVKNTFKQINQQLEAAQNTNSPDQSTNSDQPPNLTNSPDSSMTNSPDQTTNSSDSSMTNSPDQSTNSADQSTNSSDSSMTNSPDQTTNSPDQNTNSAPSTNSN